MAKKIKFPLVLKDDVQVRTIEELREYFDLEKIVSYYQNGKLMTWLEDRYYDSELEQIQSLNEQSADFVQSLCIALGAPCPDANTVDVDMLLERQKRLEHLKQYTADTTILSQVDQVAFNQEDLADVLDEGYTTVYLCDGNYRIPLSKERIRYIGIGNSSISNWESIKDNYKNKHIEFVNFESAKEDYAYLWNSFEAFWKHYSNMDIPRNPIESVITKRTPEEFYNTKEYEHRSEKKALEIARNAVGEAYIQWSHMFSYTTNSCCIYNNYGFNGSEFLREDCRQTVTALIELANTLYVKAMDIGDSIDDVEIHEKYVSLLQPLQKISTQFEKYKTLDQATEQKIIAKLDQIYEQYNRDYTYEECIRKVNVGLHFYVSQNKKMYGMGSPNSILIELCNYTNKKVMEWCNYVEQLMIIHLTEPLDIFNATTDKIYEEIQKLLTL